MKREVSDFIGAYLEYSQGLEGDMKIHLWSALTVLAAAIGRKCWLDRGYFYLFPNLYTVIVGKPGIAKKSSSTEVAVDIAREVEDIKFINERLTPAVLLENMAASTRYFTYRNGSGKKISLPHSSVFAYVSEMSVFMEDFGGGSIATLLITFYDAGSKNPKKPWTKKTKGGGEVSIMGPSLTMLCCTTPRWLATNITSRIIEEGLASRMVFVVVTDLPNPVAYPIKPPEDLREKLVSTLIHISTLTGPFTETPEAKEVYKTWYESYVREELQNVPDERFLGYAARKGDIMMKLAMLSSVSRSDDLEITPQDYANAALLLHEVEQTMLQAFGGIGENERAQIIVRVWEQLPVEPDWISFSQLMHRNWLHTGGEALKLDLFTLRQMGLINEKITETGEVIYQKRKGMDLLKVQDKITEISQKLIKNAKGWRKENGQRN